MFQRASFPVFKVECLMNADIDEFIPIEKANSNICNNKLECPQPLVVTQALVCSGN